MNSDEIGHKILLVEDSRTQAAMMAVMLEELSMVCELVVDMAECQEKLASTTFDAVLLDLILPDSAGLDTLAKVRAKGLLIPIVVLTSLEDEQLGLEAMKSGADDYLVKSSTSPHALARSIHYAIERKRQSARIEQNEQRLRATIDSSYDAFIAIDENLKIVEWNAQSQSMFGYTAREAAGKTIGEILTSLDDDGAFIEDLKSYFLGKESGLIRKRRELLGRHRSDRQFPSEVAFFPVNEGSASRLCTFVSDITSRKDFEKHVSEFYSSVAHELRNPLTSIAGSLKLMSNGMAGEIPEESMVLVDIAAISCDRLIRLIGDLLDLSKFNAGKMPLNFDIANAHDLATRSVAEIRGMAQESQVSIELDIDKSLNISCDNDRILQVVVNLLSNAIKFSPAGGKVTVSARYSGDLARFTVSDQGAGISEEGLAILFQKFQQLDNQKAGVPNGTGLGLTISKAIVIHHHGDIGVDSTPGKGSQFWFEIPGVVKDVALFVA